MNIEQRLQKFTEAVGDCHIWVGAKHDTGYGRMKVNGKMRYTHRVSYELHIGSIPKDMKVCHTCDNTSCLNPAHLFLGTQRDNILDCARKGRLVDNRGCKHGMSILNESKVLAIRASTDTFEALATQYGVKRDTIRSIRARKSWTHI